MRFYKMKDFAIDRRVMLFQDRGQGMSDRELLEEVLYENRPDRPYTGDSAKYFIYDMEDDKWSMDGETWKSRDWEWTDRSQTHGTY